MRWLNFLLTACSLSLVTSCFAQDITDVETKPYGSYSGGAIDTVDLATGNLTLNIPLVSYPQRGSLPPLSFSIELNNSPYSQSNYSCDPLAGYMSSNNEPVDSQSGAEMLCQVYSSRYDPSPPGAVFQVQTSTVWWTPSSTMQNPDQDCGPNPPQDGSPCQVEDVWVSEYPSYGPQVMGAYITSSFEGGIVTGQLQNAGCCQNGETWGAYQFSMIDPSGTTHELESDTSNWNIYHAVDGSGFTFIPANTPVANPSGSENAYNALVAADGIGYIDSNADWIGNPSGNPVTVTGGVRLGTLYSPTGIQYSDSIAVLGQVNYVDPFYTPRALYSTAKDPSGNTISRGPWYWTGYLAQGAPGSVFTNIQSIYSNSSLVPPPDSNHSPGPYYVDSVGRVIPDIIALQSTMSAGGMVTIPWVVPGPNGQQVTYTIKYGGIGNTISWTPGETEGNPDPSIDMHVNGWAISSVTLPNNTQWGFTYTGADIQTLTNPIGGSVSFGYTAIPEIQASYSQLGAWISAGRCNGVCHAVQSRTETDGLGNSWTTTYSYGFYIPQTTTLPTSICPAIQQSADVSDQFAFWTTETDPEGNDTVHSFCAFGPAFSIPVANEYHEVETQSYKGHAPSPQGPGGSGTLLKTVYDVDSYRLDLPTPFSTTQYGNVFSAPSLISSTSSETTEAKTYSNDIGKPLATVTKIGCGLGYNGQGSVNGCSPVQAGSINVSYNVPVEEATYLFGEQSDSSPLRTTTTTFEFESPLSNINGQSYTSNNLIALPLSETTTDGTVSGTTSYYYDQNNGSPQGAYGNLTVKTQNYSLGGYTGTQTIYNSQGMPTTKYDADSNPTVITYDNTGLFPSEVQRPPTGGVAHNDYYSYDTNTGSVVSHTDENGSAAGDPNHSTSFSYDVMGRVTSISYPGGGGSTFCYTDLGGSISGNSCAAGSPPYILYTSTLATPDPSVMTAHAYDGWARQYRSELLNDSGSVTYKDTTYDWAGRVVSVSNPYRGSPASLSPACGNGYTCYTYDPIGRKTMQTQPDGSKQQWCYDGVGTYSGGQCPWGNLRTDFWDETMRHTSQNFDALGRLISVFEPDPNVGTLTFTTSYSYDVFNDLTSVNQAGNGTPVQRAFAYDMPSRVTWSCNPEAISSGQSCMNGNPGTTYVYDGNSNLTQKTDNRGIVTNYHYDALNRLTYKTYSDSTPSACFQYDNTSIANGNGRLASQWTQAGACLSSSPVQTRTIATGYNPVGKLLTEQRCMGVSNCAGGGYSMTYTYDLADKLTSYPSGFGGFSFSRTYDSAGRLQSVTNSPQNATLFSSPSYTPAGALSGAQFGTAINMTRTFDVRQRVTGETDTGPNTGNVPGTGSVVILGTEQGK